MTLDSVSQVALRSKAACICNTSLGAEAVGQIEAVFDVERHINGLPAEQRSAVRRDQVVPLVVELESWMRTAQTRMSLHADVGRAMGAMLKCRDTFDRFLRDGRICLMTNMAKRVLRGMARDFKAWLFVGIGGGGDRAAAIYTLIITTKLNGVDSCSWLAHIMRCIFCNLATRLHELLPWNWSLAAQAAAAA